MDNPSEFPACSREKDNMYLGAGVRGRLYVGRISWLRLERDASDVERHREYHRRSIVVGTEVVLHESHVLELSKHLVRQSDGTETVGAGASPERVRWNSGSQRTRDTRVAESLE